MNKLENLITWTVAIWATLLGIAITTAFWWWILKLLFKYV